MVLSARNHSTTLCQFSKIFELSKHIYQNIWSYLFHLITHKNFEQFILSQNHMSSNDLNATYNICNFKIKLELYEEFWIYIRLVIV